MKILGDNILYEGTNSHNWVASSNKIRSNIGDQVDKPGNMGT